MENRLQTTLTEASKDLLYPSESDYPFEYVEWERAEDRPIEEKEFLKIIKQDEQTPVSLKTVDDIFKNVTEIKDWYGEEEKANVQRFIALKETLQKELTDIQVFKVGSVEIDVYIMGKAPDGKYAGLRTKVIET